MVILTDNPIQSSSFDKFGYQKYAEILSEIIIDTDDMPFSIGIFSEWGSGKSSLINLIKEQLSDANNIKSIFFNPWKYDRKEDLWSALIQTILYDIIKNTSDDEEILSIAKRLAKSTAWIVLKKSITALTSGAINGNDIESVLSNVTKQDEIHYRHVNNFENDFETVVNLYTNTGKLVIFIDDLDRCLPENAITVLESIKLFIGNSNCIFVFAMDPFIIEKGINERFGDKMNISGRDYLDKIIQLPFFLPPIEFNKLKQCYNSKNSIDLPNRVWALIQQGFDKNPRNIKRFINCYYLLKKILSNYGDYTSGISMKNSNFSNMTSEVQSYYLSKLLIFQMRFRPFYSLLKSDNEAWEIYEEKLVSNKESSEISETLNLFPYFKPHWENERLKMFMKKTCFNYDDNFPQAPGKDIVEVLLHAFNIVGQTQELNRDK